MVKDLMKAGNVAVAADDGVADHCEDEAQGAGQEVLQVGRGSVDRGAC